MRVCPRVVSTPVGRDQYGAGEAVRCGVSMVTAALPTGALQQLQTASAPDIGIRVVFLNLLHSTGEPTVGQYSNTAAL